VPIRQALAMRILYRRALSRLNHTLPRALLVALTLFASPAVAGVHEPTPSAGCDAGGLGAGLHTFEFTHDGILRTYDVYQPESYDDSVAAPMMLNLHSLVTGGTAIGIFRLFSQQTARSESGGYIVVEPSGTGMNPDDPVSWNAGEACCNPPERDHVDDVGFVAEVIDRVFAQLCIDERKVYASGMSNGGYLSHRLACELPRRIAAIAPVSGSFSQELVCVDGRAMPVVQISGELDNLASRQASVDRWLGTNECGDATTEEVDRDMTCTTHTDCRDGVEVMHCVVDDGNHCFFSNAEHVILEECPLRDGPLAQDVIWDFVSDYALPVPEPSSTMLAATALAALSTMARRRRAASPHPAARGRPYPGSARTSTAT